MIEHPQDYAPGDPATYVIGKREEQPARIHAPLTKKPRRISAKTILADIKLRRQDLEPIVMEYERLKAGLDAIKEI